MTSPPAQSMHAQNSNGVGHATQTVSVGSTPYNQNSASSSKSNSTFHLDKGAKPNIMSAPGCKHYPTQHAQQPAMQHVLLLSDATRRKASYAEERSCQASNTESAVDGATWNHAFAPDACDEQF
eukprot:1140758-Pelagomonas_calceolata.AAC.6